MYSTSKTALYCTRIHILLQDVQTANAGKKDEGLCNACNSWDLGGWGMKREQRGGMFSQKKCECANFKRGEKNVLPLEIF